MLLLLLRNVEKLQSLRKILYLSPLLEQLIHALYLSPSGNNLPSREFILITDKAMLLQLSTTTPYMKWLEQAAAGYCHRGKRSIK